MGVTLRVGLSVAIFFVFMLRQAQHDKQKDLHPERSRMEAGQPMSNKININNTFT